MPRAQTRRVADPSEAGTVREALDRGGLVTIGDVLAILRSEFADVSISKIRFLEDQGLVEPARSPSGYRKFTAEHVERLRTVLTLQRDHFLPLRVIKDLLESRDATARPADARRGGELHLVGPGDGRRREPRPGEHPAARPRGPRDRDWLMREAGCGEVVLAELEEHGLLEPPGPSGYAADDVETVRAAASLAGAGLRPRHLRFFKVAADREVALVDQAVAAVSGGRDGAREGADEARRELAAGLLRLHAALVARRLAR